MALGPDMLPGGMTRDGQTKYCTALSWMVGDPRVTQKRDGEMQLKALLAPRQHFHEEIGPPWLRMLRHGSHLKTDWFNFPFERIANPYLLYHLSHFLLILSGAVQPRPQKTGIAFNFLVYLMPAQRGPPVTVVA